MLFPGMNAVTVESVGQCLKSVRASSCMGGGEGEEGHCVLEVFVGDFFVVDVNPSCHYPHAN